MAPPIIITPLNDFLGGKGDVKATLNWVEQLAWTIKLWYQQFIQWSTSCTQVLFKSIVDNFYTNTGTVNAPYIVHLNPTLLVNNIVRLKAHITTAGAVGCTYQIRFNGNIIRTVNLVAATSHYIEVELMFNATQLFKVSQLTLYSGGTAPDVSLIAAGFTIGLAPEIDLVVITGAGPNAIDVHYMTLEVL